MKLHLSRLTLLNSAIFCAIAVVLAISTIWGLQHLRAPYQQLDTVNALNGEFLLQVLTPIDDYLSTGDASKLSEASQGIESTIANAQSLEPSLRSNMEASLSDLAVFLDGDFRAAGKLSGNPQALLLQNERETRDELSLINRYALDGYWADPFAASEYIKLATGLLEYVHAQALNREAYFKSFDQQDFDNITRAIESAKQDTERLQALPLLGVMEEAEEDFGLSLGGDDEETEDKGIALRDNLGYLINRYVGEIDQTRDIIRQVSESRATLQEKLTRVDQIFSEQTVLIKKKANESYTLVRTVLFATVIAIILFACIVDVIQRSITKRIRELVPYLEEFANGDFRKPIDMKAMTVEVQSLTDSSNKLRESMSSLVGDVQSRVKTVNSISHSLEDLAREVDNRSTQQQDETGTISVSIEQMNASFNEVAQSAAGAADAAMAAEKSMAEGNQHVQDSVSKVRALAEDVKQTAEKVGELRTESESISSVVTTIEDIAEQTNLLALNAAIEAARAGEQGRGFAVVADEVRGLSLRTTQSTKEIKSSIEKLQAMTRQAVEVMEQQSNVADSAAGETANAGAQLNEIVNEISRIKEMNSQIAVATEEQSSVASDISRNIQHIRDMSNDTSQQAALTQTQVAELLNEANALIESANRFTIQ